MLGPCPPALSRSACTTSSAEQAARQSLGGICAAASTAHYCLGHIPITPGNQTSPEPDNAAASGSAPAMVRTSCSTHWRFSLAYTGHGRARRRAAATFTANRSRNAALVGRSCTPAPWWDDPKDRPSGTRAPALAAPAAPRAGALAAQTPCASAHSWAHSHCRRQRRPACT